MPVILRTITLAKSWQTHFVQLSNIKRYLPVSCRSSSSVAIVKTEPVGRMGWL